MAETETESSAVHQYLSFFTAGEEYAVPILEVTEIVEYTQVTRMPSMPASIRGVTNLRGRVVPVVDLAVRMGLPQANLTRRTCIVMVEARLDREKSVVGLLVDSVSQVMDLPPSQIEPPPTFGTRIRVDFVRGMGRVGTHFVPVLELGRLLDADELLAAGRVAPATEAEGEKASAATPPVAAPAAGAAASGNAP
ncbi:MAG TPA: chemotaxis protein CheW [Myxococcales bacterium]|jgi:purine-binding chemotaxis protein CheW